jgi:hypothetical protein
MKMLWALTTYIRLRLGMRVGLLSLWTRRCTGLAALLPPCAESVPISLSASALKIISRGPPRAALSAASASVASTALQVSKAGEGGANAFVRVCGGVGAVLGALRAYSL